MSTDFAGVQLHPGDLIVYAIHVNSSPRLKWGRVVNTTLQGGIKFQGIDVGYHTAVTGASVLRDKLSHLQSGDKVLRMSWLGTVPIDVRRLLDPDDKYTSDERGV